MKRRMALRMVRGSLQAGLAVVVALSGTITPAWGQGTRKDDIVLNARGTPLGGAMVRVCTANATGQPCAPLALIYSDPALTQAMVNPTTTDGLGNYFFYAQPGRYLIEIAGPGIVTRQIPNVVLPNDPAAPTFTSITSSGGITGLSLTLSGNLTVNGSASVVGNLSAGGLSFQGPSPWFDVTSNAYNASGSAQTTNGTIMGGTPTLNVLAALDFKNGQGVAVLGAGPLPTILTPTGLAVAQQGTIGTTTYTYRVAAIDNKGGITAPSGAVTITNGNATLSGTNYNRLTWTQTTNASMYVVYGRSGALVPIGIARVQTDGTSTVTWNDYDPAIPVLPWFVPAALPTTATPQILTTTIASGGGTTALTLAAPAAITASGATVRHDDTIAIQAAINAATVAGGIVYLPPLPANGQYNFGNLDLSQLGTLPNQGWVVLLAGAPMAPYMPIVLNRGLHALGGLQQGTQNPSFHRKPFTALLNTGINPYVRVTGAVATPVRIENIGIMGAFGDGIVVDTGVSWFFMDGVTIQSPSTSTGSPLVIDMRAANGGLGTGFGYYIRNSVFAQTGPNVAAQPSMNFIGGVTEVHLDDVYIGARGIAFGGTSSNNTACTGSIRNMQTESLLDSAYITISGNQQCRALLLDNFQGADPTIIPTALFNVTSPAALRQATINGGDGYNVLFTGTGAVSGVNVWDTGAISTLRISTGTVPDRLNYGDNYRQQFNGQTFFGPSLTYYSLNMLMGYPTVTSLTTVSGSGLPLGTYCYVVTGLDSLTPVNETGRSNEMCITTTVPGTQNIQIAWNAPVSGMATGYRVYRGTVSGGQTGYLTAGSSSPFTDVGGALSGTAPPTEVGGLASILKFDGQGGNWWLNPSANMGFGTQSPGVKWDFKGAMRTDAQFTSMLPTGAPFSVASSTPIATMTVANHPTSFSCGATAVCAGTQQTGMKVYYGTVPLAAGTVTVTGLGFTSGTSYVCTATDQTTAAAVSIPTASKAATQFVLNGTGTDVIAYSCVGN